MKNLLAIIIVVCSFSTAFATKARIKGLSNALHLSGTQTVFTSPYQLMSLDNFIAFESGNTTATTVDNGAEGSVLMNIDPASKLFVSLGHLDESVQSQRKFMNGLIAAAYKTQQNPAEIIFAWKNGSTVWGMGTYYSNFNDKIALGQKESSAGFRIAASHGDFKWKTNIGLVNTAVNSLGSELNNDMYFNLGLRYSQNNLRYGLDFTTWNASQTSAGGAIDQSHHFQDINLRFIEVNKTDVGEYFMGLGLQQINAKNKMDDKKFVRTTAPVIFGAETKANDWLVVRGSVTQTVLIAQSKNEVGYTSASLSGATGVVDAEFSAEANNTAVAVGLGLLLNKIQVDATLKGLTGSGASQNINGTELLAQAGVVYKY